MPTPTTGTQQGVLGKSKVDHQEEEGCRRVRTVDGLLYFI